MTNFIGKGLEFCTEHRFGRPGSSMSSRGNILYGECNNCTAMQIRQEQILKTDEEGILYDVIVTVIENGEAKITRFEHFVKWNSRYIREVMEGI